MKKLLHNKALLLIGCIFLSLCLLAGICVLSVNAYVVSSTEDRILAVEEIAELGDIDCILVLGCRVMNDGSPSHMLEDRLLTAIDAYNAFDAAGNPTRLLMSGDHGRADYDEVGTMKQFAMDRGINSNEIFMDHAGFSTYESLYRAKEIFGAEKIVIVTQEYHLYRALHIAEALGIEAYGISSDLRTYSGQIVRDLREVFARNKDFVTAIAKPLPTYLGEKISLEGSGDVTNDD